MPKAGEKTKYAFSISVQKFNVDFLNESQLAAHPIGLIDLNMPNAVTIEIFKGLGVEVNRFGLDYPGASISYFDKKSNKLDRLINNVDKNSIYFHKLTQSNPRIFLKNNKLFVRQINPTNEAEHIKKFNLSNFATFVKDDILIDHLENPINADDYIYVSDAVGALYISNWKISHCHHSYFLQPSQSSSKYGIGKAVTCAGHINIVNGKIEKISNSSGHYHPLKDHLYLLVNDLFKRKLLSDQCIIETHEGQNKVETKYFSDIQPINTQDIIEKYK